MTDGTEDEMGDAVDDAMAEEIRRQKARFVQHIVGLDRIEGTGRAEERWDEGFDRHHRDEGTGEAD